jgi:predicted site-specific integrase-resolvase
MAEFQAGGMTVEKWLSNIGREGRATASRWIADGMIEVVNILGKNFITKEEDERFWVRAKRGEFARENAGVITRQKEEQ